MKFSCKLILTFWVCLAKQSLTHVIKYFSVTIPFMSCCDAKHLDILGGSSHLFHQMDEKCAGKRKNSNFSVLEFLQVLFSHFSRGNGEVK